MEYQEVLEIKFPLGMVLSVWLSMVSSQSVATGMTVGDIGWKGTSVSSFSISGELGWSLLTCFPRWPKMERRARWMTKTSGSPKRR